MQRGQQAERNSLMMLTNFFGEHCVCDSVALILFLKAVDEVLMMAKRSRKSVMTGDELRLKLLQAVKEMKAGKAARVTVVEFN